MRLFGMTMFAFAFIFATSLSVVAAPIVFSFTGTSTGLNGERYTDGFEIRFEADTADVDNGRIEGLRGTVHLMDGRSGTLDDLISIRKYDLKETFTTVAFNPSPGPDTIVEIPWDYQREIGMTKSDSGDSLLDLFLAQSTSSLVTANYGFTEDFEVTGLANINRIATDFAGQAQSWDNTNGVAVETSLGTLVSFSWITFSSTVVPEPSSFWSCLLYTSPSPRDPE